MSQTPSSTPTAGHIGGFVAKVRRRLARRAITETVRRWLPIPIGAAALAAALRPIVWPLHDAPVVRAALRAGLLAGVAVAGSIAVLAIVGWRRRPSMLVAARAADEALETSELVASAFAFERDQRDDEMVGVVLDRASAVVVPENLERVLARQTRRSRSRAEKRILAGAIALMVVGLAFGAVDRLVVERTLHPMSKRETAAASELKRAAEASAKGTETKTLDPNQKAAIEAAQRAAAAAERGDRKRALDELEEMRKAASKAEAERRDQARALRAIKEDLDGKNGPRATSAGDALAKTTKELDSPSAKDPEQLKKLLERLEKAEKTASERSKAASEAREGKPDAKGDKAESGAEATAWSRAASALKEAREAAARGDSEGAKRAMERASQEISAIEKAREAQRAESERMAKLGERGSALDRSLRAGMNGGEPEEGDGSAKQASDGEGKGKDKGAKGKSEKNGDGQGGPGPGGGDTDREGANEQRRVKVEGNLQARTDVKEGERAVSAIEGMGQGDNGRAYAEIFPSYDTVVEEGLREDLVPAARRPTVRRYFSLIRPSSEEPPEGGGRPTAEPPRVTNQKEPARK